MTLNYVRLFSEVMFSHFSQQHAIFKGLIYISPIMLAQKLIIIIIGRFKFWSFFD